MTRQEMAEMILQKIDEFEEESVLKGYLMEHRGEIVEPMIEFLQNFDKPVYDAMLAGEQSRWNKERERLEAEIEERTRIEGELSRIAEEKTRSTNAAIIYMLSEGKSAETISETLGVSIEEVRAVSGDRPEHAAQR